jgi:hypothetical protein
MDRLRRAPTGAFGPDSTIHLTEEAHMRKLLLLNALWALLFWAVYPLGTATAGVTGPEEYRGHNAATCEAATHASWYDPRNGGQTAYDPDYPAGDNVYYVDTDPLAGFKADGKYPTGGPQPAEDCQGSPILRMTFYGAATYKGVDSTAHHVGFPKCSTVPDELDRNPSCFDEETGASGGFYVGTGDRSHEVGYTAGAKPFRDE